MADGLIHEILPVGMLQCNCSVIGDSESRECIVVDPGDEVERILALIARYDFKVRAIVNTHAHIDHVGGLRKMQRATGAPVLMHQEDLELYRHLDLQAAWIGIKAPPLTNVDGYLHEGDAVRWGRYTARVIDTPGHTPGSICLYLPSDSNDSPQGDSFQGKPSDGAAERPAGPGRLLAGDTLFAGSIGRTDLWGGSFQEILRSIHSKLLVLPDETIVYPGHGPSTTIGQERETNPFVRLR